MRTGRYAIMLAAAILIHAVMPAELYAAGGYSEDTVSAHEVRKLRYNLRMDLAVTAINTAGYIGTYAFEKQLAPSSCYWCSTNAFDDWGHRNLKWSDTGAANTASNVTAFALAPLFTFGLDALAANYDGSLGEFPIDAIIIAEAASAAAMFTQIIKFTTGRQRPYAHYSTSGRDGSPVDNTSFYSNHTAIVFALAVSSGTVATMRNYRLAPLLWGAGLATAAGTGYLRVASDKHYLTDVIAGAVIGSAFGFGIPYIFHRPYSEVSSKVMISASPIDGGGLLCITGAL